MLDCCRQANDYWQRRPVLAGGGWSASKGPGFEMHKFYSSSFPWACFGKYLYHPGPNYYKIIPQTIVFVIFCGIFLVFSSWMQCGFVMITKIIASKKDSCNEFLCNDFGRDGSLNILSAILVLWLYNVQRCFSNLSRGMMREGERIQQISCCLGFMSLIISTLLRTSSTWGVCLDSGSWFGSWF